jgi:cellulose synthase/poly-beta-1,6-N-acetylglucosamine synthase-like glycosyltransferase
MALLHSQVRLLDNPKQLSSEGRNVGFRNGTGDIFLVVDGHCFIPERNLLKSVVDCFEKSGADSLGRPQPLDPPGLTLFQQAVAYARSSRLGHGGDSLIYSDYEGYCSPVSNGAAYRKEVFEKVGYVDGFFDAAEDVEFNYRVEKAGLICYTSPRLTVRYYPRTSLGGLFRQMKRYGMGRYRFIMKHREALTITQLFPAGFVVGMLALLISACCSLSNPATQRLSDSATMLLSAVYALYILVVLTESFILATRNGWVYLKYLPLIFFTVHFGLGWGFLTAATACNTSTDQ